jgi:cytochrome c-type biogenesis protein CcmH
MGALHTFPRFVGRPTAARSQAAGLRQIARLAWACFFAGLCLPFAAAQSPKPVAAAVSAPASAPQSAATVAAAPAGAVSAVPVASGPAPALAAPAALGPEAAPMTDEPVLEARLLKLSEELRCLVCQNESLASSRAELADDLRREVRELLREGKSDQQVKTFLVERYGDFVLYRPEIKPLTWLLWFGPFVLLLGAVAGLGWYLRQSRAVAHAPPLLSDAERARADQWLKD